jgi:hypothetical protein
MVQSSQISIKPVNTMVDASRKSPKSTIGVDTERGILNAMYTIAILYSRY